MRFLQYIPQALLLLGYAAAANTADKESAVISLTAANFDRVVNAQPVMLVAFVSSKSLDCEALAPEYEKAAKMLGYPLGIVLASVDCADQANLCATHRVEHFPYKFNETAEETEFGDCAYVHLNAPASAERRSFSFIRTGRLWHGTVISSYEGPVEFDKIFRFILTLPVPATIEVTATNHDDVKASADIVFIGYMSSPTETSATIFSDIAERQHDSSVFGLCTDEAAIAAAGITPPAVVAYRKFDLEPRVFTKAEFTVRELRDFVDEHSLPLVGDVGALGYLRYRQTGLPLAFLFIERDDPDHALYVETLRRAAEKYRGRIAFGYTASRRLAGPFGLQPTGGDASWPAFAIQYRNGGAVPWVVQGGYTSPEIITEFVDAFAAGALVPQADLVAASASQGTNVREVGRSEFDTVVFDDEKDVFLEVYASRGCQHCMRLKPTWDVLGDTYAGLKDRITIARIDVEAARNDIPFSVTGVPWLRLKTAGTRDFIDFQGGRSLDALVKFVETHATSPLPVDLSSEVVVPSGEDAQREFHSIK